MSLVKIEITSGRRAWGLWKIEEPEQLLIAISSPYESIPTSMTNPNKRLEFAAGRALIKNIADALAIPFTGIAKDVFGKPSLKQSTAHMSLSHSWPYVAAIIDHDNTVGIDLEQPKDKLLRIAHRVLNPAELEDAGTDVAKHCIYWCAKESLVKIHGKKDLVFAENLNISPFTRENDGQIIGSIIVNNNSTAFKLRYSVQSDFVVVFNE